MIATDPERDAFYQGLYQASTAPFITAALTEEEVRAFRQLSSVALGARVLDLACGWGRHLAVLREQGIDAVGLERSAPLAAQAARKGPVVRGDLRALPFQAASFDAVACFYSSLFFFDEAGNRAALAEAARVLKPGGALMMQSASPLHLRRLGPESRTHPLPDGSTLEEQSEFDSEAGRDQGRRRLTRPDGSVLEGSYSVRHYAPGELEVLGRQAGLRMERLCGSLELNPFTRQSRELIVLMRRTG